MNVLMPDNLLIKQLTVLRLVGVGAEPLLAVSLAEVPDLRRLTDRLDLQLALAVYVGAKPPTSLALVKILAFLI